MSGGLFYIDGQLYDPLAATPSQPDLAELQEMAEEDEWELPAEQPWTSEDEDALEEYEHRKRRRMAEQQEY